MTFKIRNRRRLPIVGALSVGTPNQASLPSGFSPLGGASSCLLPPRVITVPFSGPASDWVKKLSGNQAVSFTSPGRQTVWVWCSVESAQLRERTWTGASHCTAAHSHLWVASHQTELSIARTKRQRRQPGWCAHLCGLCTRVGERRCLGAAPRCHLDRMSERNSQELQLRAAFH